jgi:hypothetical protein
VTDAMKEHVMDHDILRAEKIASHNPWFALVMHNAVIGVYPCLTAIPAREVREWTAFTRSQARLYEVDIWLPRPQVGAHVRPEELGWRESEWHAQQVADNGMAV